MASKTAATNQSETDVVVWAPYKDAMDVETRGQTSDPLDIHLTYLAWESLEITQEELKYVVWLGLERFLADLLSLLPPKPPPEEVRGK